eukprot:TRINITY_DN22210_c0_g1_i1.p1 TRINITY_DN22210_c0_g1~~TRINITY_DN22210_c0_g1_i1.p1  ORF type:complete len:123 (-),score=35.22 TRINITY_DN22210_c0_g1_i1:19-387(-)
MTGGTIRSHEKLDPLLPAEMMETTAALYACSEAELRMASPLYEDDEKVLRDFPPCLFHVGENEVLLDDTLRMAEKISNVSQNHVEVVLWKDLFHVFHLSAGGLQEADEALRALGQFMFKYLK